MKVADTQTKPVTAKPKKERRERQMPKEVGFVDTVPARTRNDFWSTQVEVLRANPGRNKQYEANSSTTASYLKGRYGFITTTRARSDGKFDLFVQYPGKVVDGAMVPDDVKSRQLIERYGSKSNNE